ncbi:MAG: DUF3784 domain-containing protein [Flavobacteriaceae bacterium]|jgi:TRAP-type mannitol/chloroaromatic compound transport system permease small subunit|nr:DUF3784 domain-containing protein [Flavobacteriaceae bacterium]CAI8317502.1 MAG: Uncharacterised protein [Flavobacteriaceae bacterium]
MIIILLLIDFILLGIAYCMNPKNAKYLLSGYNTMSDKERDSFDIINYLKFMKSFFIKISIYSTMLFVFCDYLYGEETAAVVWAISLTVPWPYFIIKSQKFYFK